MAYAYCRDCRGALDFPDFEQIIQGYIECSCETKFQLDESTKVDALVELKEKVDNLEYRLNLLEAD